MARGRMINRKVSTSEKIAAFGEEFGGWACTFHHRLIAFLDKNGNCRADPYWLKAEVMPRVAGVSPEDCRTFAAGLVRHGLAVAYEHGGMPYLHMPGFRDEQVGLRPDRETREVPVPQGFDENAGKLPESIRQPSGGNPDDCPPEVEGEGEAEVEEQPTVSARTREADLVDGRTDDPAALRCEMEADVEAFEHRTGRTASAKARLIVQGEDATAWQDQAGAPVPWPDRPRLLRLALAQLEDGQSTSLRGALRYVIPQQYDPAQRTTAAELAVRHSAAAGPTPTDALRATEAAEASRQELEEAERAARRAEEDARIAAWEAEDEVRAQRLRQQLREEAATLPGGHLEGLREGIARENYRKRVLNLLDGKADPHAA